jgi:hypothetical protein
MTQTLRSIFYLIFVLALYGTTFTPHSIQWVNWKPWVDSYIYVLAIIGGCTVIYTLRPPRYIVNSIGYILGKSNTTPDTLLVIIAFTSFFCLTYYLSGDLFAYVPTELDSMAQYAGAKIFAGGHWTLPSHLLPRFFDTLHFINDGKFYTFYPPGHMLILAVGHIIGSPAIINPLLGAFSLVATFFLAKEIAGSKTARISLVLFLISPFIVFLASEYDNRTTALLCATLFALFYIKAVKSNRGLYGIISGVALGYLVITRPQTAIPYAAPFVLYAIWLLAFNVPFGDIKSLAFRRREGLESVR